MGLKLRRKYFNNAFLLQMLDEKTDSLLERHHASEEDKCEVMRTMYSVETEVGKYLYLN